MPHRLLATGLCLVALFPALCAAGDCSHDGAIDAKPPFSEVCPGSYTVHGAIAANADVRIVSRIGAITIEGDIGPGSRVTLRAPNGKITINGDMGPGTEACLMARDGITVTGRVQGKNSKVHWWTWAGARSLRLEGIDPGPPMDAGLCPQTD